LKPELPLDGFEEGWSANINLKIQKILGHRIAQSRHQVSI
jgi:hypothetical protein